MRNLDFEELVKKHLNKKEYSRDAVEVLMRLAFEEGVNFGKRRMSSQRDEDERERNYGSMFF